MRELSALLLSVVCLGLLAWILVLLRADRHDRVVRAVAVVRYPRPAPVVLPPDRPLVNPRFAAYIATRSAEFAASTRVGRHVFTAAAGRPDPRSVVAARPGRRCPT